MILEQATVVSIDKDGLWVETINASACGSCRASHGCGQKLLAGYGSKASIIKALFFSQSANEVWTVGDRVNIGIHEQALVKGALSAYLPPLAFMICAVTLASYLNFSEKFTVLFAIIFFILGGCATYFTSRKMKSTCHLGGANSFHPVVISKH